MVRALLLCLMLSSPASAALSFVIDSTSWSLTGYSDTYVEKNGVRDYMNHGKSYPLDTESGTSSGPHTLLPDQNLDWSASWDGHTAETKQSYPWVTSFIDTMFFNYRTVQAEVQIDCNANVTNSGTPIYLAVSEAGGTGQMYEYYEITDQNRGQLQWVEADLVLLAVAPTIFGNYDVIGVRCKAILNNDSWVEATYEWRAANSRYEWKVVKKLRDSDGAWVVAGGDHTSTSWQHPDLYVSEYSYALVDEFFDVEAQADVDYAGANALTAGQTGAEDLSQSKIYPKAKVRITDVYAW